MTDRAAIRDAATVVLLRDGDAGLEVLLLRRHGGHVFGANAHVFPGGAVDTADADARLSDRCTTVAPSADEQPLAYRMAGIRECFEEAGVLVGCDIQSDASLARISAERDALNAGTDDWQQVAERLDLRFQPDRLVYFAYWLTPRGAPRRYATRFFVAAAPDGQTAMADGRETTRLDWLAPHQALARQSAGDISLMPPTQVTLQQLCDYKDTDAALAGLARVQADQP